MDQGTFSLGVRETNHKSAVKWNNALKSKEKETKKNFIHSGNGNPNEAKFNQSKYTV